MRIVVVALLFLVVLLGWGWDHSASRANHQAAEVLRLQDANGDQADLIQQQTATLQAQQDLDGRVTGLEKATRDLSQTLIAQGRQRRAEFLELKANDQDVRAYLAIPVPGPLGLQYARPETTYPLAWRQGARVPADAVPTARPQGASQ